MGRLFNFASLHAQPPQSDFDKFVEQRKQGFDRSAEKQKQDLAEFESEARQRYEAFRNKANADYADFMQRKWIAVKTEPAVPVPPLPEPPEPVIKDPEDRSPVPVERLPFANISPLAPTIPQPTPPVPIIEPAPRRASTFAFKFYNTPCEVRLDASQRFSLPDVSEKTVADVWRSLASDQTDMTLLDCLVLRNNLLLGDWGYINLLQTLTESFFGKPCSEATLLQMYLLTQSGYKVRLARVEERLVLLVAFSETLYQYRYISKGSDRFFIMDTLAPHGGYHLFDYAFPEEQLPSLRQEEIPALVFHATESRTFRSDKYPSVQVSLATNRNLMDFYNHYPLCSQWQHYVSASLSDEVKEVLYPALRVQIGGKSQTEAVALLLDFVQTAFEYQTDDQQFGYERPLFGDETFFYPYSDCEDRSILFAILVRELVGLNVVLLNYPGHLATAVKFTSATPPGSYFPLQDGSYVICDPTYIHAGVGECMPQFKGMSATIIRI
ncbi:MAG: transglutaminase-like domain-containing protein [Bacteroides sp.]|nr:transglutaminase-like domain-containing protein [Bacteroides sp.]